MGEMQGSARGGERERERERDHSFSPDVLNVERDLRARVFEHHGRHELGDGLAVDTKLRVFEDRGVAVVMVVAVVGSLDQSILAVRAIAGRVALVDAPLLCVDAGVLNRLLETVAPHRAVPRLAFGRICFRTTGERRGEIVK